MGELYIGHLATANYDFYIVAVSEDVMWEKLQHSWENHAKKTNAIYTWEDVKDSVWWQLVKVNQTWKKGY
jgi:hypothetical protein